MTYMCDGRLNAPVLASGVWRYDGAQADSDWLDEDARTTISDVIEGFLARADGPLLRLELDVSVCTVVTYPP